CRPRPARGPGRTGRRSRAPSGCKPGAAIWKSLGPKRNLWTRSPRFFTAELEEEAHPEKHLRIGPRPSVRRPEVVEGERRKRAHHLCPNARAEAALTERDLAPEPPSEPGGELHPGVAP